MSQALPPPRKVPVVPRPRRGELSASYLARVARANRTGFRSFASLLGRLPSGLSGNPGDLMFAVVTLNDAAFARLLSYTAHAPDRLIRAIPSLAPATFASPGEPPALRVAFLRDRMSDCPQCRLRRDRAFLDTRLFPLKMACLHHGYWLYGQGAGWRLPSAVLPEIAAAQKQLTRLAARRGTDAAVRAYELARHYLQDEWRARARGHWYTGLNERWQQRSEKAPAAPSTLWPPSWALHPECAALAAIFASPYWAAVAVPAPDRGHRRFYQHLLTVLGVDGTYGYVPSIRNFDPLPDAVRERARWGRLLSDPEWGDYVDESLAGPRLIPFIDITKPEETTPGAAGTPAPDQGFSASRPFVIPANGTVELRSASGWKPEASVIGDAASGAQPGRT
jgi:hypothetical protein